MCHPEVLSFLISMVMSVIFKRYCLHCVSVLGFFSQYALHALLTSLAQWSSAVVNAIRSVHFRFSFEVYLHDSFFSHKHITSLLPPLHTEVEYDLGSGQAGSSGKQNKAIWFLRPYCPHTKQQTRGNYPVLLSVPALLSSCFLRQKNSLVIFNNYPKPLKWCCFWCHSSWKHRINQTQSTVVYIYLTFCFTLYQNTQTCCSMVIDFSHHLL